MKVDFFNKYSNQEGKFSLREIKYGRARISLLRAFVKSIENIPLEEIRIRDLCNIAEVSEPSFYNYFPRKDDLFLYFISLWSVDVQLHIKYRVPVMKPGLNSIREIFRYTAESVSQSPRLMKEIIAYQARIDTSLRIKEIRAVSDAEKTIVFGKTDELYDLPDQGLQPLLTEHMKAASLNGEISKNTDIQKLTLLISSIFFGIPVITLHQDPQKLNQYYQICLDLVFNHQIPGDKFHEK